VAKILVVEDDLDIRLLLRLLFEAAGHEVLEAHHGAAAIECIKESPPDLVITDIAMPVMDGRELVERLRSDPETAAIPVLVVSAHTRPEVPGADGALAKPFLPEEVLEASRALLESEHRRGPS
jgi:CheY-like chemotaxis protein